jgi:protein phosphatase
MFNIFKKKKNILTSISDIGKVRSINEDRVITLEHPLNSNIKLLAVADGMGGCTNSSLASEYVINKLKNWFTSLNINSFNKDIDILLYNKIIEINNKLVEYTTTKNKLSNYTLYSNPSKYPGTTLTCAIITLEETIIANIGDSRAYAIIKDKIVQLTKDDSYAWLQYEENKISKDEIRFSPFNSYIYKCIGHNYDVKPYIASIKNNYYTSLLLFTDGITDCLSDNKIKIIVNKTNNKSVAKKLIHEAVYSKKKDILKIGNYTNIIKKGKDNASVALYIK